MKVLHLSHADQQGGAARAAYRLHQGLRKLGVESSMFVQQKISDDASVFHHVASTRARERIRRVLRRRRIRNAFAEYRNTLSPDLECFTDDRSELQEVVHQLPRCDVLNLHWPGKLLDYVRLFSELPKSTAIVWTLHDMNPLTGGCHYDVGCGRFAEHCGACPLLGSSSDDDLTRDVWQRKNAVFSNLDVNRLRIVALSRWMADTVARSSLLNRFCCEIIPNGLNVAVFAPHDKLVARSVLGIPAEAKVILFVADSVDNRRKGFSFLAATIDHFAQGDSPPFLLSVGSSIPKIGGTSPRLHLGSISDDRFLSLVYSAADVFVVPSIQDNLPNTVMESLACGVPVVGFNVGGIPDMVREECTGKLVPEGDVSALADAIQNLLQDSEKRLRISLECRRVAIEEYSDRVQASRYMKTYLGAAAQGL